MLFKKYIQVLKNYETWEHNSQRLNKGYSNKNMVFTKIWRKFYQ